MPHRIHARAAAGLAALAVTAGGVTALTTAAAHAATAAAVNGPISYNDGKHWSDIDADGSGQHTVTPTGGGFVAAHGVKDATFSPDGSWAVFVDGKDSSLWLSWADGTHARRIASGNGNTMEDPEAAWSPDEKTIAFDMLDGAGYYQLATVPSDGSAAPTVLVPSSGTCRAEHPGYAPNGDLAYAEDCTPKVGADSQVSVKIIDSATGTVKRTIPQFTDPQFSPDGTKLVAFSMPSDTPTEGNAYLMAADGSGAAELNKDSVTGCLPGTSVAWSPDGSQLASAKCTFPSDGAAQSMSVYVQAATPGSPEKALFPLTSAPEPMSDISWGTPFTAPTAPNPGRPGQTPPPPSGPGRPYTLRLGGADRVGTAITVADAAYGPGAPAKAKAAVLTRADSYADALAGNALAAQKDGPLLLTGNAKLDPAVGAELGRLLPKGSTVYILGGTAAVSPQVDAAVRALGLTPKRLAGSDRFQTATTIAAEISPHPHTVLVATGVDAPDALAAGAAAATDPDGGVVLLSDGKTLPASTKAYLAGVNPATAKVYGVGVQGVTALITLPGFAGHMTALEGVDRYATDAAVANDPTLYPHPAQAALATGRTWPDALSGGAYAGALHAPLLLTDGPVLPAGAAVWLHAHGPALTFAPVFGGPQAVPDAAVRLAGVLAWGAGNFDLR